MLSWLFNVLWDLFCSAPWWLEIVIACGVFWILLALLLLFIFIFYHILLFFGVPALFLIYLLVLVVSLIISILKALGISTEWLIEQKEYLEKMAKNTEDMLSVKDSNQKE